MKTDRIKVSMEFNIMGSGLWLTAECPIAPDEDVVEEFKKQRSLLLKSFETITGSDYSSIPGHPESELKVERVDRTPKEQAIDSQIEAIQGCTSLKSLEIFKKLVDREAVPRLTEAYFKKDQELSGQ